MTDRAATARGVAAAAVLAAAAATPFATLMARSSDTVTSYTVGHPVHLVVAVAAGAGLGLAGALLLSWPPGRHLAWMALAAAVVWSAPEWAGWEAGPELPRSVAELIPPAALVVLAGGLALCHPTAPRPRPVDRAWLRGAAVLLAAIAIVRALVRDPFLAADCWRNCNANLFVVAPSAELAAHVDRAQQIAAATVSLLLVGLVVQRAVGARRRRAHGPTYLLATASVLAVVVAAQSVAVLAGSPEHPDRLLHRALALAAGLAALAFAVALAIGPLVARRTRRRVRQLADELTHAPSPGEGIAAQFGTELGDPTLQVAFPLPDGRWVDDRGLPVAPPGENRGRALARVERRGTVIASLEHDPTATAPALLAELLRPAARIALENARLNAVSHAQVRELRAIRRRIVADGDNARRRLERDLHDGAQQALLSPLIALRVARSSTEDLAVAERLDQAVEELASAIAELRAIARGIHPAGLDEGGVTAAVDELLDDVTAPVVDELTDDRFPPALEFAAYRLFAQALATPARAYRIRLARDGGSLFAEADLAGAHAPDLDEVADRFAALGGTLESRRDGDGSQVRGVLPLE